MSTSCNIGILNSDNTVSYVYCHWDGYISGVGATLIESYNSGSALLELMANGSMSYLDSTVETTEFYDDEPVSVEIAGSIHIFGQLLEYNYLWIGDFWVVGINGKWYHLATLLEAEIEIINSLLY